jgi:hypothetical protein
MGYAKSQHRLPESILTPDEIKILFNEACIPAEPHGLSAQTKKSSRLRFSIKYQNRGGSILIALVFMFVRFC